MRYADYQPTNFDDKGAFLSDRQDWLVAPCSVNRDSGPLDRSNWEAQQKTLDEKNVEYEIHQFNHWACGWFEIALVSPEFENIVKEIQDSLEDYPVLDEEDYSAAQMDEAVESWSNYGHSEFINAAKGYFRSTKAKDRLDNLTEDQTWEFHMDNSGNPYEEDSSGIYFPEFDYLTRDLIKELLEMSENS